MKYNSNQNIEDLREREAIQHAMIANLSDVIAIVDQNGVIRYKSPNIEKWFGWKPEEIINRPAFENIHPDDHSRTEVFFGELLKSPNASASEECRYRSKDLTYKWIELTAINLLDDPNIKGILINYHDITERKHSELALLQSQARLNRAELASKAGNWEFHLDSNTMIASEGATKVYGVKLAIHDFDQIQNIPLPEYRPMLNLALKNLIEKNEPYRVDFKIKAVDTGEIKDIHSVASYDKEKRILFGIIQDISDRKRVEEALRISEEQLRGIFDNIQDAFFQADLSGKFTLVSPSAVRMYGFDTTDELLAKPTKELYGDPGIRTQLIEKLYESGQIEDYIGQAKKKDGTLFWASMNLQFVRNKEGQIIGTAGVVRDISERIRNAEILRASEERFRTIFNLEPDCVKIINPDCTVVTMNPAGLKMIEVDSVEEIKGKSILRFINKEFRNDFVEMVHKVCKNGESCISTFRITGNMGTSRWLITHSVPLRDLKGEITGLIGLTRDITEQRKAEESLQKLNLAISQSQEIIFITDREGIITFVNPEFTRVYGYSAREILGKETPRILKSGFLTPEAIEILWEKILGKECIKAEYVNKCKDGSLINIEGSVDPILDENDEIIGFLGIHRNISDRKRAESEIIAAKEIAEQSNHLKSALLNNLSHEIRTPMNAIMGFSDLMKEADADEKNRYAEIISNSSNQLLSMIDDVILLSRLQSEKIPLDNCEFKPAELISEIRMVFDHPILNKGLVIKECIPVHLKYMVMRADVKKIRQVIINFVSNSLKYTFEGSIEIGFELKEGIIEFFVRDTGMGIPEHEKELIFEVFYRTEQVLSSAIRGTGLGLNIAKELIDLMGGNIGVQSELGKGSSFYFTVPFKKSEPLRFEEPPKLTFSKGLKNLKILIVDDEYFNIQYLEILLRNKVKKIDRAYNGKEAVEMAIHNNYDLVLMDLKMPIMDGVEATRILKEQFPEILIIAQTACAFPEEKESAMQAGCDDFIVKPINKEKMIRVINKFA